MTVVKCDKHPANYCVIFDGSEVISALNFVVGACALRGQLGDFMGRLAHRVKEGDLYAVALGDGREALCWVLYKSTYFKDIVLMGCYGLFCDDVIDEENFSLVAQPIYTGASKATTTSWRFISVRPFSAKEKDISLRIVAREVWLGDDCLGVASSNELATLPIMDVYGERLFIKKICQALS